MADMEFFTESGRVDHFEFEKIDIHNLNKSLGNIEGVTGGSLTFDYLTDLKVSGSIDVVGAKFINNCLIRVWYKPTLNGKTKKIELCTCFASTEKLSYVNGVYSGTIDLKSVLARHTEDKLHKNYVLSKKSAVAYFKNIFKWLGGHYKIKNIRDKKFGKAVVMEYGKTPMDVLWKIADLVDGEITCDTHGRTVLQKYVKPKNRACSGTIPSGAISVVLPGLEVESSLAGTPNRAAVKFTYKPQGAKNEKTLYGIARAAKTNGVAYENVGRFITETYDLSSMSPKTQARIDAIAKAKLASLATTYTTYEMQCFFIPIKIGEVVRFKYDGIDIDALVESIDMQLSVGGMMKVKLRKVRTNG